MDEIQAEANRRGAEKRVRRTKETIKAAVLQYDSEGRDVSYTGVLEYDKELAHSIRTTNRDGSKRYYEDWTALLEDCNLLHAAKKRKQSRKRIIEEIREYADEHGPENLVFEVANEKARNLVNASHRPDMFGSWIRAVEAAGFKYGPSWFSGKGLPNNLSNDSVRGMFSEKRAREKKNAVINVAVKIIKERGAFSRPDLKNETMVVNGKKYKLLSQIEYNFGGIKALTQELIGGVSPISKTEIFLAIYKNTGSGEALDALYDENIGLINRIADDIRNLCASRGLPCLPFTELHDQGFIAFERAAVHRYDMNTKFSSYAWRAVRNEMIRANRRLIQDAYYPIDDRGSDGDDLSILDKFPAAVPDTAEKALMNIQIEEVSELIKKLPKKQRDILRMRYKEGMTQREIGEILGVTHKCIEIHEKRAISYLKAMMCR